MKAEVGRRYLLLLVYGDSPQFTLPSDHRRYMLSVHTSSRCLSGLVSFIWMTLLSSLVVELTIRMLIGDTN